MDPNYSFTCGIAFDFYNPVLCATSACKRRCSYTLFIFVYDGGSYTYSANSPLHNPYRSIQGGSIPWLLICQHYSQQLQFLLNENSWLKCSLRIGPLYCGKIEGILQLLCRRLETNRQRNHYSVRS